MPYYRLYFLDADGHITHREECDLSGDETARAKARALDHAEGIEIWQGNRKVSVVTPARQD
jgi:hypothetical protein